MNDTHRQYEIRCPIHGFIGLNDWELAVVNTPEFQRLRRIRQLAFTEFVYPGATHSRFEHSLGVMHVATRIYDSLVQRFEAKFRDELDYDDTGFDRDRQKIRFAALLHDVGHGPLSHASEDLMPLAPDGEPFTHEQYSAAVIRTRLRQAIENHPKNENSGLTADEVADLLEGKSKTRRATFWRDLLTGQLDADRMDYLLRDSHHAGVQYGRYDLARLVATAAVTRAGDNLRLGFEMGGLHAAEAVVLARYFMFTQVYFHKTRVAFDHVLRHALKRILPDGKFPAPQHLGAYLEWDDWKVLGMIAAGECGEWGEMIRFRRQLRCVYETPEIADSSALEELAEAKVKLGDLLVAEDTAAKNWYKSDVTDVQILTSQGEKPLSRLSSIVGKMLPINQTRLYVRAEHAAAARARLSRNGGENGGD